MASWAEFEEQAPELASRVRARFEAHKHLLIATLRRDGAPRISGIEVLVWNGGLWLGMMPASMKGRDLVRDPRFALHSAPVDLALAEGDAKVGGRAHRVTDEAELAAYWQALGRDSMEAVVFRADLDEAAITTVSGDELVIDSWRAGDAPRQVRRK
ncbi:MAG: pyridoxamine 5'-phosphate oxidase family protein [Dehalococcoidia bacterium]|nr:pyridoxamine 5'-phosphate oxidase family protein [Dehalococcoidia bacterium]